jgi:hypothetical protein
MGDALGRVRGIVSCFENILSMHSYHVGRSREIWPRDDGIRGVPTWAARATSASLGYSPSIVRTFKSGAFAMHLREADKPPADVERNGQ